MKKITTKILISLVLFMINVSHINAQVDTAIPQQLMPQLSFRMNNNGCGTWVFKHDTVSPWFNGDTIKYNPKGDTTWVYTEWEPEGDDTYSYAVYYPCGQNPSYQEVQSRINDVGIVQKRYENHDYEYLPKPKPPFERKLDSLNAVRYRK